MTPGDAFKWTEPAKWPWIVWVWLILSVGGLAQPVWRWFKRNRASSWLSAQGKIDAVDAVQPKELLFFTPSKDSASTHSAELRYSYSVGGSIYSAVYKREFPTEWEAGDFLRGLEGKSVEVLYNPNKPSSSTLPDFAIEALLRMRTPVDQTGLAATMGPLPTPAWLQPFLSSFVWLSAAGFILSCIANIYALLGRQFFPQSFFFLLHIGIFVVWFPAVYVAKGRIGNLRRKDFWKAALKGVPDWMRYFVYAVLGYSTINAVTFWIKNFPIGRQILTPVEEWRFFSDTWMVFYAAAFAILYAATQEDNSGHCLNGHPASPNSKYCDRCGQPVVRSR